MSKPYRGEQRGPVDRVDFLPLSLCEPNLRQHAARSGVPVPDHGVEVPVASIRWVLEILGDGDMR